MYKITKKKHLVGFPTSIWDNIEMYLPFALKSTRTINSASYQRSIWEMFSAAVTTTTATIFMDFKII